jgi:phosphoenolpyruvate synthase/pyruvate phosphate dikinase
MKGYRKDQMFYGLYCQEFLFREIGRRAYLSLKQVRQIYPWEMKDCIIKKKIDTNELNARSEYHIFYSLTDKQGVLTGNDARQFLGKLQFVKEKIQEVNSLDGDTASPGKVRGRVVVVNVPEDMKNMKDGSILVSIATSPDLIPAIKKAGAIVTDMGGVTCHAAIISRELGIPCLIGTKIATKVLKEGYLVDVDATHGRVNIISKDKN